MVALLAFSYSDRYIPAIADWYLEMAVPTGAGPALQLLATTADDEVFFVCARHVARRIGGEDSIVTFSSATASEVVRSADGAFTIRAHVDQSLSRGNEVRKWFACTVRQKNGSWKLENLEFSSTAMTATLQGRRAG